MKQPIDEQELHLYVDGRLDRERQRVVEAHLRDDPEAAARVSDFRRQNELMRQLFAVADDGVCSAAQQHLEHMLERRLEGSRLYAYRRPSAAAAALLVAAGLGAAATSFYEDRSASSLAPAPSFAPTATRGHRFYEGVSSEASEFAGDGAATLRLLLDKRFGAPLRLPDLSAEGFSLVSGRLLSASDGAAAQLLYRDEAGRIVTVLLGPADQVPFAPLHATEGQGLSLYVWHDRRIGVAVVGGMSGDELRDLAEAAQRSLLPTERRPAPTEGPTAQGQDASRT